MATSQHVAATGSSEVLVCGEHKLLKRHALAVAVGHDAGLLVLAHTTLKEVCLALRTQPQHNMQSFTLLTHEYAGTPAILAEEPFCARMQRSSELAMICVKSAEHEQRPNSCPHAHDGVQFVHLHPTCRLMSSIESMLPHHMLVRETAPHQMLSQLRANHVLLCKKPA